MILGLDISTSLGWALRNDSGKAVGHGVVKLESGPTGKAAEANASAVRDLLAMVEAVAEAAGEELGLALEGVDFSTFTKAHASYWRVRTVIVLVARMRGYLDEPAVVSVSELKRHAMQRAGMKGTGKKSRVTKADMVSAAIIADGVDFPPFEYTAGGQPTAESKRSGDKADALHVTSWALERAQG